MATPFPPGEGDPADRPSGPLRVFVQADDPLVAGGLGRMLEAEGGAVVVTDAGAADVAVWDAGVDPERAAGRLDQIGALAVPTVALVADESHSAAALAAGARGVVARGIDAAGLAAALWAVRADLVVVDAAFGVPWSAAPDRDAEDDGGPGDDVASGPLDDTAAREPDRPGRRAGVAELTARERQVLALLARGLSNKQIARRLDISDHTAKFHVVGILGKLGAATRTEAVVLAARQGLVTL